MDKDTIRHRSRGRGRKATWVALAVTVLIAAVWTVSPLAGREQAGRRGRHGAAVDGGRSFTELAAELREHRGWLERAGLTALQADALIDRLDRSGPVFDSFRSEQADLTARLGAALAAPVVSRAELSTLRSDFTRLASAAIDESFALLDDVAADLTPEQREDLLRFWEAR